MDKKKPHHSSKHKADPNSQNDIRRLSSLAFEIVVFNIALIWGGHELDIRVSNEVPWLTIIAALLSVSGTIYYLFRKLNNS